MKYSCKKHPTYQAKRAPTADCGSCRAIYAAAQPSEVRTDKPVSGKRLRAADLIAKKVKRGHGVPSDEAMKELREIVAFNDTRSHVADKVSKADAVELLRTFGWGGRNGSTLDRLCQEVLDRRSYAQK